MPLPATYTTYVNNDGDDQDNEINAIDRVALIDEPRVDEGGERQKNEAEQRQKQIVIGALEVVGEDECQDQNHSWKQQHHE